MIATETVQQQFQDLVLRVEALEKSSTTNRLALGVMTGNLDTTIAAFIIALGATAYDMDVEMFFTFWATAALRDPKKTPRKGFLDRMFGRMLPRKGFLRMRNSFGMVGSPDKQFAPFIVT